MDFWYFSCRLWNGNWLELPWLIILHSFLCFCFSYLIGNSWGPDAACCRCQGAMTFYNDMHQYYELKNSSEAKRNHMNTTTNSKLIKSYPNWMTFSDDDYFVRMTYTEAKIELPERHNKIIYLSCPPGYERIKDSHPFSKLSKQITFLSNNKVNTVFRILTTQKTLIL